MPARAEILEYALPILLGDSNAGVANAEAQSALGWFMGKSHHSAATRREFDCIGQKIEQDLLQRTFVAVQMRQTDIDVRGEFAARSVGARLHKGTGRRNGRADIDVAFLQCPTAGFDLCKVENV